MANNIDGRLGNDSAPTWGLLVGYPCLPSSFSGTASVVPQCRIRYIAVNQSERINAQSICVSSPCESEARERIVRRWVEVPTEVKDVQYALADERNRLTSVVARLFSLGRARRFDPRDLYEQAIRVRDSAREQLAIARLMRDLALSRQGDGAESDESAGEGRTVDITDRLEAVRRCEGLC